MAVSRGTPAIMRPRTPRGVSGGTTPTTLPRYITTTRSASAATSSSSVETSRTATPSSRSAMTRLWMNSMAPTSTPRVGWAAMNRETTGLDSSRARTTFCWFPPDSEPAGSCTPVVRTSNSATFSSALAAMTEGFIRTPLVKGCCLVLVEDHVLGDRERAHQAIVRSVLGHEPDPRVEDVPGGPAHQLLPVEGDRAGDVLLEAHDRLRQLGLAVALDARHAHDLAAPDVEVDVVHDRLAGLIADGQPPDGQHDVPAAPPTPCPPSGSPRGPPSPRPARSRRPWAGRCPPPCRAGSR